MSTPEQPATPALTRKQLRDIRNTGATPIIDRLGRRSTPRTEADGAEPPRADETARGRQQPSRQPAAAERRAPGRRAAAARRSAGRRPRPARRRRERRPRRLAADPPPGAPAGAHPHGIRPRHHARGRGRARRASGRRGRASDGRARRRTRPPRRRAASRSSSAADAGTRLERHPVDGRGRRGREPRDAVDEPADATDDAHRLQRRRRRRRPRHERRRRREFDAEDAEEAERAVVRPRLRSGAAAPATTPQVELPPSFDQLHHAQSRRRGSRRHAATRSILSQTPSAPSIVAPVTATGEVLITGSFNLPEGLGSTGHAAGTADGKETDAVLVDGELPAHSSPTPIAASAAISTVKNARRDHQAARPPRRAAGSC